jgi:hypothetical protein
VVRVVPESPLIPRGLGLSGCGCIGDGLAGACPVLACAGPRLRSQEGARGEGVFARCARVFWCLPSMLAPARSRCRLGCAGWLRWLRASWVWFSFRVPCLGEVCVGMDSQARARCWLARDRACARRKAQGAKGFSRGARGFLVFAFNARSGPIPLPPGVRGADGSMRDRGCLVKRAFRLSPRSSFARAGLWGSLHRAVRQN